MTAKIHVERMMHRNSISVAGETAASYALIKLIPSGLQGVSKPMGLNLALVLDVSERARARQESRRLLYKLAHADRVSMMGELAATLAHEVSQPLTAILSNAQAAERFLNGRNHSLDLDEVREILGDIARDCARLSVGSERCRGLALRP